MNRLLPILIMLSGCGDPSITVVFQIGDQYRPRVVGSTLRVYEPLQAEPFDCDQLAFGQVDAEVLRLSLVSELSLAATSEAPLEVDRVSKKLFWAEGLDQDGRILVNGCAEQGELTGDTEVPIDAEPTKLLKVLSQPSLSVQMGMELSDPITFLVTDLDEEPLSGAEVRWVIDAAGGTGSNGSASTSATGSVEILPIVPSRPGPFILDVRIRWADQNAEPVTGFVHPAAKLGTLPGRIFDYRSGAIGPNGEKGFAALIDGELGEHRVAYVYQTAGGELQTRISQDIISSAPQIGLIEPRNAGERARVIVVGIDDWVEVGIDGALTQRPMYTSGGLEPVGIEMSGSCEPGSPPQVFISYLPDAVGIFDSEGMGSLFGLNLDLIASGCVTDETAGNRRILILADAQQSLFVASLVGDTLIGEAWLAFSSGVGFAPPIGTRESMLLGTQLSMNDVVISRYVVRSEAETLTLVERGLDSPGGFPLFTQGGDIDGDGLLDIVSLLDKRVLIDDPPRFGIFSALGLEREGKRIAGDFEIQSSATLRNPEMMLIDIDSDGVDDVVIAERTTAEPPPVQSRFEIYEMGAVTPK